MNSFGTTCLTILASAFLGLPCLCAGEALPSAEIERLTKELGSTDYEARLKAQDELVDLARKFYTQLATGLGSEDPETRQGVTSVLARVENELRVCRIAARIPEAQRAALRALSKSNPGLYGRLGNPDPAERKKACKDLAERSPDLAIPVLAELALDGNRIVRNHAVHALGLTGNVKALPCLKQWVECPDSGPKEENQLPGGIGRMRMIAINGIGGDKDTGIETRPVSEVAVESIGKIKHADAARFLIEGLDASKGARFQDYLKALEETGQTDAAVTALLPKLSDTKELDTAQPIGTRLMARLANNTAQIQPSTVGDAAFLSILRMTDQKPEDYGIEPAKKQKGRAAFRQEIKIVAVGGGPGQVFIGGPGQDRIAGNKAEPLFPNEEARATAIEKLKAWWKHSKGEEAAEK